MIRSFGDPDVFETVELDRPSVEPNHVLVRVEATSVNPVDHKIRSGSLPDIAPDFPAVLHGDVAGTVVAVGAGVEAFDVGDEVYGCPGGVAGTGGALAEYVRADAASLAHKPDSLSMREAAALPLVTITAWDGVVTRADVGPGDSVLVYGGAGGVGHLAVQLADRAGGVVHATGSTTEKRAIARRFGANHTIDYREQSVEEYVAEYTDGEGFDVVFDSVGTGKDNLETAFEAAGLKGQVLTTVAHGDVGVDPVHAKGLSFDVVFMLIPLLHDDRAGRRYHGDLLDRVAMLVDEGELDVLLDEERFGFDAEGVAAAHRRLASGEHVGKVTIARE